MIKEETDGTWMYNVYLGGRKGVRRQKRGFASEREAYDAVAVLRDHHKRQLPLFTAKTATIRQAADNWIERMKRMNRHPQHIKLAERAFWFLARVISLDRPATEMTGEKLDQLLALRRQDVSANTAWLDVIQVRGALRYAAGRMPGLESWAAPDVSKDTERPRSRRNREYSPDEEARIIGAMIEGGGMGGADLFIIAMDTAMRVGEIFGMRYSDVHPEPSAECPNGWLMVRATKTGNRSTEETDDRPVPMTERAKMVLESRRNGSDLVFPQVFDHDARLKAACERAEIPYGRKVRNGVVFHDTRHTAISRMLRGGADPRSVMDLAGHKSITTTMVYAHSTEASRSRAIAALEQLEKAS
jgi:integrase